MNYYRIIKIPIILNKNQLINSKLCEVLIMIKNIVLDVGGIIFDDSKDNIQKVLNKNCDAIYKIAYGKGFKECLLGIKTVQEYIKSLSDLVDFKDINYILDKENLSISYPLIEKNFKYIRELKQKGYKMFLLTNITEDSYNYINSVIDIDNIFDGGIYSYQEKLIKPDSAIYTLLIDRFKLDKTETICFDDKEKNVIAANDIGIKSVIFNSIEDIENSL